MGMLYNSIIVHLILLAAGTSSLEIESKEAQAKRLNKTASTTSSEKHSQVQNRFTPSIRLSQLDTNQCYFDD